MPHLERVAALQSVDPEWREHALNPKLSEQLTPESIGKWCLKRKMAVGSQDIHT